MTQVRTLLLANGSSIETVENLSATDFKNLYVALKMGLWGPIKDYRIADVQIGYQHQLGQMAGAWTVKGFKYREPLPFHELFPIVDQFETLGKGEKLREHKQEASLNKKFASFIASARSRQDTIIQ